MLEEEQRKSLDAARQPMTGDRAITVGGNVSGSILITGDHNVLQGITFLPTDYATRIRNFILEYIGTPQRPVPFGGRQADLQTLDGWLDDPAAPPYLLLTAPAGRGKSALLVRWLERRRDLALPVVFVPISLRFNTASQTVFFAALAARLAHLFGERVPADMSQAPDLWRGMASGYLSRPAPDGRLLVVLDGLDEATDWQAGVDLFPFEPPPGLRVVVAARHQANESGPEGWLRRLGWERNGLARSLTLAPLTHAGVSDVLRSMGVPLDALSARVDIVAELYRLSEGDPLLVRLYVDDLWQKGAAATRLQPEDLRTLQPGLHGYFDRWWEDQRKQWGRDAPLREPAVQATLNLLTTALAPLGKDDLLHLSNLSTWDLEEALRPLARLVVGDGRTQGYAFSHPRLGQYFREKLSQHEQQQLEERFLQWGQECAEQLCTGKNPPEGCFPLPGTHAGEPPGAGAGRTGGVAAPGERRLGSGRRGVGGRLQPVPARCCARLGVLRQSRSGSNRAGRTGALAGGRNPLRADGSQPALPGGEHPAGAARRAGAAEGVDPRPETGVCAPDARPAATGGSSERPGSPPAARPAPRCLRRRPGHRG